MFEAEGDLSLEDIQSPQIEIETNMAFLTHAA